MIIKNLKQRAIYLMALCFILINCKPKQTITSTPIDTVTSANLTEGIVSHQYKSQGCETIIICTSKKQNDTLFLIPTTPLEKFDIDGLKITFSYRNLRIHNPKGCHKGIPAQIFNVEIIK